MAKKQTQRNRKILLSTLIPLGVIAAATAITLPIVLKKDNVVDETKDKELIDLIDETIKAKGKTFNTMSDLLTFLKDDTLIDLQKLEPAASNVQYVWDQKQNVVFLMNSDGTVHYSTDSSFSPSKTSYLWKMVKPSTSYKLYGAAQNISSAYADSFDPKSPYCQFLRDGYTFNTQLSFCSGLDTGSHEKLELTYTKEEGSKNTDPVIINTQKSSLTVNGLLSEVNHFGNLTQLAVDALGKEEPYNEYGSVDAAIIIKSGNLALQSKSEVAQIIVDTTNEDDVRVNISTGSKIGTIGSTDATVAQKLKDTIVEGEGEKTRIVETEAVKKPDPRPEAEFYSGDGTIYSPWVISNKQQLLNFVQKFNNDTEYTARSGHFYCNLINDIDMGGDEWTPLGIKTRPFKGIFNGCGFKIKDIKYKSISSAEKDYHLGLFGYTEGDANSHFPTTDVTAVWDYDNNKLDETNIDESYYTTVIKNITIDGVECIDTNKYCIGGVAGVAQYTYFNNCKITHGTIHGFKHVGGIVGTGGSCIFKNCIAGEGNAPLSITADIYHAGGIAGSTGYSPVLSDINSAVVLSCETGSNCTIQIGNGGNAGVIGGIVADNQEGKACVFDSCINRAKLIAIDTSLSANPRFAAGIVGRGQNVQIVNNCYNTGKIMVQQGSQFKYVAGIIAEAPGSTPQHRILHCYNLGEITGYADSMAGIAVGCSTSGLLIDDCHSDIRLLSNDNTEGKTNEISDQI